MIVRRAGDKLGTKERKARGTCGMRAHGVRDTKGMKAREAR